MGKALVIVDMLNDFIRPEGKLYFEKARGVIAPCVKLREAFKAAGLPVVYDNNAHPEDSEEFKVWPPHCIRGTVGAQVVGELAPQEGDLVMEKDSLSLFSVPEAAMALRGRGITEFYLCGVATEYCVLHAALDGLEAGFTVNVAADAIAGVDLKPGDADRAIAKMRAAGVRLLPVNAVIGEIAGDVIAPE